jgi:hypothetical protein
VAELIASCLISAPCGMCSWVVELVTIAPARHSCFVCQHTINLSLAEEAVMNHVARGEFVVKLLPLAVEGQPVGSKLGRMSINKEITGDLIASSTGQMLSAGTEVKGSAGYVAIERVEGTLHARAGAFVLQHTGSMGQGAPSLSITVVPDSGSGDLVGLVGDMKIAIADGKHRYVFDYTLP